MRPSASIRARKKDPAGLTATLAQGALAGVAGGIWLTAFLSSLMTTKNIATALVASALVFAVGGYLGLYHARHAPMPAAPELPQRSQTIADLRKENAMLRANRDQLNAENAKLTADLALAAGRVKAPDPESPLSSAALRSRQRAVLNNLRQIAAAVDQFTMENRRPPALLDEIVGETKYIPRLDPVYGEIYSGRVLLSGQSMTVTMTDGVSVTYDPKSGQTANVASSPPSPEQQRLPEMERKLRPAVTKAFEAYRAAHPGKDAIAPEGVLPYFATPQEGADFVELLEAGKAERQR